MAVRWRSNTLCATNARNRLCITTADLARSFISARLMWPREFFCICSTPFFICFSSSIADLRRHTRWITSAASSKCRSTLDWNSFTKLDKVKSSIECARAWPAGCDAFALPFGCPLSSRECILFLRVMIEAFSDGCECAWPWPWRRP